MKTAKHKIIALILALSLFLSLTACWGNKIPDTSSSLPPSELGNSDKSGAETQPEISVEIISDLLQRAGQANLICAADFWWETSAGDPEYYVPQIYDYDLFTDENERVRLIPTVAASADFLSGIFTQEIADIIYSNLTTGETPLFKDIDGVLNIGERVASFALFKGVWSGEVRILSQDGNTATAEADYEDYVFPSKSGRRTFNMIYEYGAWKLTDEFVSDYIIGATRTMNDSEVAAIVNDVMERAKTLDKYCSSFGLEYSTESEADDEHLFQIIDPLLETYPTMQSFLSLADMTFTENTAVWINEVYSPKEIKEDSWIVEIDGILFYNDRLWSPSILMGIWYLDHIEIIEANDNRIVVVADCWYLNENFARRRPLYFYNADGTWLLSGSYNGINHSASLK